VVHAWITLFAFNCKCIFIHATSDVVPFMKRVFPSDLFLTPSQSPLKNQTDPERSHTADLPTDLFVTHCCAPHRRWERSTPPESVAGRPANSIQAGSGYTDHVEKPAEVRRNGAVGPAATIPYSRCHSQARVVADPKKNHRHSQRSPYPPEEHRTGCIVYESYETSFVIRNYFDAVFIQPVYCTYKISLPCKPSSP